MELNYICVCMGSCVRHFGEHFMLLVQCQPLIFKPTLGIRNEITQKKPETFKIATTTLSGTMEILEQSFNFNKQPWARFIWNLN